MWLSVIALVLLSSDDKEAEEAVQKFRAAMKSPEVSARAQAVTELGRVQHEKTLKPLSVCLTTDDKQVRIAAAKALGSFQEKKPKVVAVLSEALGSNLKEADVRIAILAALENLHDPTALQAAYRSMDDKNGKVAEAAVAITGAIRSRDSIDPLIKLLKKLVGAGDGFSSGDGSIDVPPDDTMKERARLLEEAINKALASITGERLSGAKEWEAWWRRNAGTFRIKD